MVAMMFIIFLVLLLIGVPIAFSLGLSSLFYLFTNNIPGYSARWVKVLVRDFRGTKES